MRLAISDGSSARYNLWPSDIQEREYWEGAKCRYPSTILKPTSLRDLTRLLRLQKDSEYASHPEAGAFGG